MLVPFGSRYDLDYRQLLLGFDLVFYGPVQRVFGLIIGLRSSRHFSRLDFFFHAIKVLQLSRLLQLHLALDALHFASVGGWLRRLFLRCLALRQFGCARNSLPRDLSRTLSERI